MHTSINFRKVSACTLNRVFSYDPRIAAQLISTLGSPEAVFSMNEKDRDSILGPYSKYRGALSDAALAQSGRELDAIYGKGCEFLAFGEEGYPERLAACPDAPAGLYVKSCTPAKDLFPKQDAAVAIVGTRDISPYGMEWTKRIVSSLCSSPDRPAIISGLALGVDITAHRRTLECGCPTIAVLPCGIDEVSPRCHFNAAGAIATSPGSALVTDFPPGTSPLVPTFIKRNRIIAGLADATILIESRAKGGGMITSRLAFEYGRDVYALPGRIDDKRSEGCNLLVRKKLAEPIVSLSDLAVSLRLVCGRRKDSRSLEESIRLRFSGKVPPKEMDTMTSIAGALRDNRGADIETLAGICGEDYQTVASAVGMLEMEGFISMDLLQRCSIVPEIE